MTTELEKAFVTLEDLSARWPQIMDAVVALRRALEQPTCKQPLQVEQPLDLNKALADAFEAGFNTGRKSAEILPPEQLAQDEPVAWQWLDTGNFRKNPPSTAERSSWRPLYTRPQAREPLTNEQRMEMWRTTKFRGNGGQVDWFIEGTRAAEAAHGITGEKK